MRCNHETFLWAESQELCSANQLNALTPSKKECEAEVESDPKLTRGQGCDRSLDSIQVLVQLDQQFKISSSFVCLQFGSLLFQLSQLSFLYL